MQPPLFVNELRKYPSVFITLSDSTAHPETAEKRIFVRNVGTEVSGGKIFHAPTCLQKLLQADKSPILYQVIVTGRKMLPKS